LWCAGRGVTKREYAAWRSHIAHLLTWGRWHRSKRSMSSCTHLRHKRHITGLFVLILVLAVAMHGRQAAMHKGEYEKAGNAPRMAQVREEHGSDSVATLVRGMHELEHRVKQLGPLGPGAIFGLMFFASLPVPGIYKVHSLSRGVVFCTHKMPYIHTQGLGLKTIDNTGRHLYTHTYMPHMHTCIHTHTFPLQLTLILSGYLYGMPILAVTLTASLAGAVAVFSLTRTAGARELVQQWTVRAPLLRGLHEASRIQGFKIICLVRIIPFPFSLLNIVAAGMPISSRTFAAANFVSLPFKQVIYVYLGSQAVNIVSLLDHSGGEGEGSGHRGSGQEWGMAHASWLCMILVSVGVIVVAGRTAKRHLLALADAADLQQSVSEKLEPVDFDCQGKRRQL